MQTAILNSETVQPISTPEYAMANEVVPDSRESKQQDNTSFKENFKSHTQAVTKFIKPSWNFKNLIISKKMSSFLKEKQNARATLKADSTAPHEDTANLLYTILWIFLILILISLILSLAEILFSPSISWLFGVILLVILIILLIDLLG